MAHVERPTSSSSPGLSTSSVTPHELERDGCKMSSKRSFVFGGKSFVIGPRIAPLPERLRNDSIYKGDDSGAAILEKQLASEAGQDIQYRTCSWQKMAALLFSEYISLAVMSFPQAYSYVGLVPGLILTIIIAGIALYTSLVLWEFCLRHPEVRDVCDLGQMLFGGKKWAWCATMVMFILNNTFVQGLHVLVGAEYINTMTEGNQIGGCRTVQFAIVVMVLCWMISLPRTFEVLSKLGTISAFFTIIGVILATVFAGIQPWPARYDPKTKGEPIVTMLPSPNTTFAQGLGAALAISFTLFGQIMLPSFIAEMRDPREFPKSLWACTIVEVVLFSIVGAVIYAYTGNQYVTSPAFGSLQDVYKKASFSLMVPTILFLGSLYASVTTRFIFFRVFRDTKHLVGHTLVGWLTWGAILLSTWITAFIIAQVIPFFSSLLSVMSALFNSWFGLIFWGVAFFRMRRVDRDVGRCYRPISDYALSAINILIILTGVLFLTAGTYSSVESIKDDFRVGNIRGVFSCTDDGL